MSSTFDRQIRPIYDAIDTGSNKSAIVACNKLLKKQPKNSLVKALKALALVRLQKVEESLVLSEEILAAKPTDESTLAAMSHVLRGLGRHSDIVTMYDTAWRQQPTNDDLAIQTFSANARTGNWKAAQQVAARMHKQFQEDRYLYWSVFCAVLQANDPATPPALRPVLYKLAHRLITSATTPSFVSADRFYVHLLILKELHMYDEAAKLLESEMGRAVCRTSLVCDELRREIWTLKGSIKEEGQRAQDRVLKQSDRNWLEFLSVLDATFSDVASEKEADEASKASCKESISKTQEFLAQVADRDGMRDRSGPLALLELELRSKKYGISTDASALLTLAESYFQQFGNKACCYEDLLPYVLFEGDELAKWSSFLQTHTLTETTDDLQRTINALKLVRYNLTPAELTPELEEARAALYMDTYFKGLKLGADLPDTELQPADDLVILASQTYVNIWKITADATNLYQAVAVLEFGSSKSKQSYLIRLLLIRLYQLLGAPSLSLEHYRLLNVKQIQTDTLSHLILSRVSTFSLSSLGDLTYSNECMEASQIYLGNSQDTAEFIVRAFVGEKYSQIPDFVTLEDRLDNSLQRDIMKMEHVRMRVAHEPVTSDLVDMELIELKFIFDRLHYDNRDFDILPNYQPRTQSSFHEQTVLFGKPPGQAWLSLFLKIYIKIFQQASDLDDTVEDKLLIGDRPKPHPGLELGNTTLNERLAKREQVEIDDLTSSELALVHFADALTQWLGPHHDFLRPPAAAVLAEAARITEQKTGGHQLKSLTPPPNGTATANGHANTKKDEEPPVIKEPPELVFAFFDDMRQRFKSALEAHALPPELLHIVTLTQEALLLFNIETTRFKPASVIKANRLGVMAQNFKDIRTKGIEALSDMSAGLAKLAAAEIDLTPKDFVTACSEHDQLDGEFLGSIACKLAESRKEIFSGISKGTAKVCKNVAA